MNGVNLVVPAHAATVPESQLSRPRSAKKATPAFIDIKFGSGADGLAARVSIDPVINALHVAEYA